MAFCQRGSPDILSGQHDPKELAKHRDHRCRKNEEERDLRINKSPSRLEKQLVTPNLNYGN